MESLSEVYILMVDGMLSHLKSFRVTVQKSVVKSVLTRPSYTSRLHIPNLETFVLCIYPEVEKQRREQVVKWRDLERLTSRSVMPRLRRYSLFYVLRTSDEIKEISQSTLFDNDDRNIRFQFDFNLYTKTLINFCDVDKMCQISSTQVIHRLVECVCHVFFY